MASNLKRQIRARQKRTGERYMTARMHVLHQRGKCHQCLNPLEDHVDGKPGKVFREGLGVVPCQEAYRGRA